MGSPPRPLRPSLIRFLKSKRAIFEGIRDDENFFVSPLILFGIDAQLISSQKICGDSVTFNFSLILTKVHSNWALDSKLSDIFYVWWLRKKVWIRDWTYLSPRFLMKKIQLGFAWSHQNCARNLIFNSQSIAKMFQYQWVLAYFLVISGVSAPCLPILWEFVYKNKWTEDDNSSIPYPSGMKDYEQANNSGFGPSFRLRFASSGRL